MNQIAADKALSGRSLALAVALAAGLTALYAQVFVEMWIRWFPMWQFTHLPMYDRLLEGESYYTHGPLIPLVSVLIAMLLIRHTRIDVRPDRRWGAAALGASLLLHLLSSLARVNFISAFSMIGVLGALVLIFWGWEALRRLWFPILLLGFMAPLPEVTIAQMNFRLKMLAADWGVRLVNMLGIVAERQGNQTFLEGNKSLVIANVCNGLRTLISLLAFGALYAYVCRLQGWWRIGLFLLATPVAVASNSIRIVSLILVAHFWSVEAATGWWHDTSGMLIFAVALGLMFGAERLILWFRRVLRRPSASAELFADVRRSEDDAGQAARLAAAISGRAAFVVAGAMLVVSAGVHWLNRTVPSRWTEQMVGSILPSELPMAGGMMQGYDIPLDDRTLAILEMPEYLYRRYVPTSGNDVVDFCVIFSKDNRKGTHPPDLCLEGGGQNIVAKSSVLVEVEGVGTLPCRELIVQNGQQRHYFLYTYKCGQEYTGNFWRQQFIIFLNGLLDRNSSGALVRVSTQVNDRTGESARQRSVAFLQQAMPYLDRGLP